LKIERKGENKEGKGK